MGEQNAIKLFRPDENASPIKVGDYMPVKVVGQDSGDNDDSPGVIFRHKKGFLGESRAGLNLNVIPLPLTKTKSG